ncbi:MAG: M23 family metallopeptidase [Oscillospiraceae bacterium]|nr:M23 family metallopeptidase [Oscillospiraceae bacterium]
MSENKNPGRGWNGKGYYIALILCAAAIGITSYVYHQNTAAEEEVLLRETEAIPVGTMAREEDIPVIATQPQPTQISQPTTPETTTQPTEKTGMKVQHPVSGQEIFGYSMEALSYNETTRDWRVHNGVDFGAEEGTPVCAAADGTVYAAYEDDAMGSTVVIRHEGGYTTTYSSLQEELAVSAGDTVSAGQTIGYAGSTALLETTMGSHVHFSVTHQNMPVDPAEFLSLGE